MTTVIVPNLPSYLTNNITFVVGGSVADAAFNIWNGPYYLNNQLQWDPNGYGGLGQYSLVNSAFQRSPDSLVAVSISPDGKQVQAAYQQTLIAGYVNLINTNNGQPAIKGVLPGAVMSATLTLLASTPNLTRTALGNGPWAFAWSPLASQGGVPFAARVTSSGANRVTALGLSQDGSILAAGAGDGSLSVYSLTAPAAPSILTGYLEPTVIAKLVLPVLPLGVRPDPSLVPRALGASTSGNVIAAAFGNNVLVWIAVLHPPSSFYTNISSPGYSPFLAGLRPDLNAQSGPVPPTLTISLGGRVTQVIVSADGTSLFTGACDGTVSAWDLTRQGVQAGQVLISPTGSTTACCTAIAFDRPSASSGSAPLLVTTASDDDGGLVRLWPYTWTYTNSPEV